MEKTLTATYKSATAVKNVVDELLGIGFPQEKFLAEEGKLQIKVITPEKSEQVIRDVLNRHGPKTLH